MTTTVANLNIVRIVGLMSKLNTLAWFTAFLLSLFILYMISDISADCLEWYEDTVNQKYILNTTGHHCYLEKLGNETHWIVGMECYDEPVIVGENLLNHDYEPLDEIEEREDDD